MTALQLTENHRWVLRAARDEQITVDGDGRYRWNGTPLARWVVDGIEELQAFHLVGFGPSDDHEHCLLVLTDTGKEVV